MSVLVINVTHYPIFLSEIDKSQAGICKHSHYNKIYIRASWWNNVSSDLRRVVIYHELGHCLFNRQHDVSTFIDSNGVTVPNSFMYPQMNPVLTIGRNLEHYKHELIEGIK